MDMIDRFKNSIIKAKKDIRCQRNKAQELQRGVSKKYNKGVFEIADIFYMFIVGIMIYIFVSIWNPVLALFNFTDIPYGGILELILNVFALIIAAGYIAYMVKKWQSPT
jgi:hypothetical protein